MLPLHLADGALTLLGTLPAVIPSPLTGVDVATAALSGVGPLAALAAPLALLGLAATDATTSRTGGWTVDPGHSRIGFTVRHFLTPLEGRFDRFDVDLDWNEDDVSRSRVRIEITAGSINTGHEKRDGHLHSADFFDSDAHPFIMFTSTGVRADGDERFVISGDLTMKGVTQRVEVPVRFIGVQDVPDALQSMMGGAGRVASFEAEFVIDRTTFGIGVGDWADTPLLGRDVALRMQFEASHP